MKGRKGNRGGQGQSPQIAPAMAKDMQSLIAAFGTGQWAEVEALARQVVAKYKAQPFGWKALGAVLARTGRFVEAVEAMEQAVELSPNDAELLRNLIFALEKAGQGDRTEKHLLRLVDLDPNDAEPHRKLGLFLLARARYAEAEAEFRRVVALSPDKAEDLNNLGLTLRTQLRLEEAETFLRQALDLQADHPNAILNLAHILYDTRRDREAEGYLQRLVTAQPNDARALYLLGFVLIRLDRAEEAETLGRRAIAIDPDLDMAHDQLGCALRDQGRIEEAQASFRRARDLQPRSSRFWDSATLLLPQVPQSAEDIIRWRARYEAGIAELAQAPFEWGSPDGMVAGPSFFLPYHNQEDRPTLEALAAALRARIPNLAYEAAHLAGWRPPSARSEKIRVGFLSMLMFAHTIGKLMQGYIRNLDRSRFEIVLFHFPATAADALRRGLDASVDHSVELPRGFAEQQQAVAEARLDVLFYPDIGMAPETYFLAHGRLAPVQMVTWGHPVTTGLPSVDYYISADGIEAEGAEAHYSENLIRLNRLPTCYQPLHAPSRIVTREALGLPAGVRLYGCPQSLFKLHLDFDAVLHDILRRDPEGRIVVLRTKRRHEKPLLERWERNHPGLTERMVMLPQLPLPEFMALLAHVDVLLDPIHFGSGNTLYEAMVYGKPIVTWPGRFMRGRIVAGAYRQMKIADAPIAERLEDYAPLAVALAQDTDRCAALGRALREAAAKELFSDMQAVRELETLLEAAVAAAGRGEKLPSGWRPC